jgi:DNA-directed RNA polymerase subunit M/transcription elongation factor TFIIS
VVKKKEYQHGQVLNKDTGSIFLYEVPVEKGQPRRAMVECGSCHKHYEAAIKKVKSGQVCRECSYKKMSQTRLSKYKVGMVLNKKTKTTLVKILDKRGKHGEVRIIAKCGYCGQEYETALCKVINSGHYCPFCRGKRFSESKTKYKEGSLFQTRVGTFFYFDKEIKSDAKARRGYFTPADKEGNRLGKSFPATLQAVLGGHANGSGLSFAEHRTYNVLLDLHHDFQWQYSFSDLTGDSNYPLKFDFAVFYDQKICLIELDGEQHFEPVERFGGEKAFKRVQRYDALKNQYVFSHNNLYLIRIGFKKFKKITNELLERMIKGEEDVVYG